MNSSTTIWIRPTSIDHRRQTWSQTKQGQQGTVWCRLSRSARVHSSREQSWPVRYLYKASSSNILFHNRSQNKTVSRTVTVICRAPTTIIKRPRLTWNSMASQEQWWAWTAMTRLNQLKRPTRTIPTWSQTPPKTSLIQIWHGQPLHTWEAYSKPSLTIK